MATLDDRLLGEKLQYYVSSSEDEDDDDDEENSEREKGKSSLRGASILQPAPDIKDWEGSSTNTGPKGVLKDWQRYKQLETEKRKEQEREKIELAKKLSLSCRSHLEDEKEKEKQRKEEEGEEVDRLIDEAILRQYIAKRMEEMMGNVSLRAQFGRLLDLDNGEDFLAAVDQEKKDVTVIIHIYEKGAAGCEAMTGCLRCLSEEYPNVKFCQLLAAKAGVSAHFQVTGVPALLVYKGGQMVGNFVALTGEFGDDFYATDVESFLIEHGMLMDKTLVPSVIRNSGKETKDDEDSDLSVDD
ncbi:phosducin-like protein 1 [Oratosquilla oratoria]|uniref:phosducin-like protein 1 n=1 Tax=Oratosquilla oratoria TaxID=337810 RepID=UPI003F766739